MSYPINYPTQQGANVQIFNATTFQQGQFQTWTKPQGANMVWFTLIGAGGGGGGTEGTTDYYGGGSGAVTNLMIPAFLIPDSLSIVVGNGGTAGAAGGSAGSAGISTSVYSYVDGYSSLLLAASGGGGGDTSFANGGGASSANFFTAAGFFQSTAGQDGTLSNPNASGTTFLQGGGGIGFSTSSYGYTNGDGSTQGAPGFFQMSPIIVGVSGTGNGANAGRAGTFTGGIGCGGAGANFAPAVAYAGSRGGNGLAVIITW
jgi:hypothetical protein